MNKNIIKKLISLGFIESNGVLSIYGGAYYLSLVSNDAITYTSKELPEAEKAANAAEQNAGSFKDVYVMPHTFDLPSSTESNGASYTYEVVEGTAASINSDGDLVVAPLATDSKVKVKITATIGGASGEYTKEFTVKGSTYETITSVQALDIINGLADNAYADGWYYVSATVGEIYNTDYCNFYLPAGDNDQAIVVYGLWNGQDSGTNRYGAKREIAEIPVQQGDEVVLYTRLQKYVKADGTVTPELVNAMLIGPAAPSYDVYTSADENVTLGDYTLAYDANGKVIFASCTADGYGGPADGFYHDGSYSWVAGQQCGIFLLDERFAGWPAKLEDGTACWTLYTVKAPEGVTILTGSAEAMLDVFNQAFSANLTELNGNGYFENELTDGQFNDVVVNFGSSDTEESTPVAPFQHTFDLGENATEEKHVDGTALAETFELTSGENTLTVTNATKVYGPAFDAKGNSVIKFGTGSATGSITLTVGEDVDYVIFYVAQYKSNATVVDVNGTTYTIETASNNGEYTEIKVDTTTNKTVVFSTTADGKRCMLNTIVLGSGEAE